MVMTSNVAVSSCSQSQIRDLDRIVLCVSITWLYFEYGGREVETDCRVLASERVWLWLDCVWDWCAGFGR